jgi:ATP-binding cassette subfamily B protein
MLSPVRPYTELLSRYLRPLRFRMMVLAVLMLGGIGLQLAGPQAVRYFIDTAQSRGDLRALYAAAALFLVVSLTGRALGAVTTYLGKDVASRATNRMRSDLLLHVLRLDMSFHTEHTTGELVERGDGDIDKLSNFLSQFVVRLVASVVLTVGVLVLLLLDDWRMALAVGAFASVYLIVQTYGQALTVPLWRTHLKTRAEVSGFVGEHYPAVKDIQKSGAESYVIASFHRLMGAWRRTYYGAEMATRRAWIGSLAVLRLGNVVAMGTGAYLFLSGSITIGTVYLVFHYLRLMTFPLMQISEEIKDLQQARAAVQRIRGLFEAAPTVLDAEHVRSPDGFSVEFSGVSFSYLPERSVLKDLSFEVRPGRVLGVLGRTGSGKTTLSRLIFRLYDTDRGAVRLGGVDVR